MNNEILKDIKEILPLMPEFIENEDGQNKQDRK